MVSVFTYLEIPAYLFTILAVVGGAFFLYEGVPFDFENVEIQLLLGNCSFSSCFYECVDYKNELLDEEGI